MANVEKVIDGLQEAAAYFRSSFDAMYGTVACEKFRGWVDSIEQTIALLKAQEPRVMAPEDFNENPERDEYGNLPCWLESREPFIASGWNRWNEDDFIRPQMRNFRPWTSRPTDEQREAVKWDD